jgi:hypothetical protein
MESALRRDLRWVLAEVDVAQGVVRPYVRTAILVRWLEQVRHWSRTPLTRTAVYTGDVPGPDPARAPLARRLRRGLLVGGSRRGSALPRQGPARWSAAIPRTGVLGPRLVHTPSEPSGSQRSPAVSSGRSLAQVAGVILRKQARGQNPDKDEVQVLPALGSTCGRRGPTPPSSAGRHRTPRHPSPLARCRGHCIERSSVRGQVLMSFLVRAHM